MCARARVFKIKPRVNRKTAHGTSSDTHRGGLSRVSFHAREQPRLSSSALFSLLVLRRKWNRDAAQAACSGTRCIASARPSNRVRLRVSSVGIGPRPAAGMMESLKTWESRTLERLSFRKFKRKISRWYVIFAITSRV